MLKHGGRIPRHSYVLLLFCILPLCLFGRGEALAEHVFRYPEAGFTLSLPDGWIAIPQQELTSRRQMIFGNQDRPEGPVYHTAFQLQGRRWFAYPYVLVSVNRKGRVPRPRIPRYNRKIDESLKNLGANLKSMASSRLLDSDYDPEAHLYAAAELIEMKGVPILSLLHQVCYTNKGFLQFSLFSTQEEFPVYAPVLKKAVSDLELTRETLYTPSPMDKLPLLADLRFQDLASPLLTSLTIGLVLAVVGIAYVRLKDRRH